MAESKIPKIEVTQTDDYTTTKTTLSEIIADTVINAWKEKYKFYATKVSTPSTYGHMIIIGYKASDSYRSGIVLKHAGTSAGIRAFNGQHVSDDLSGYTAT